MPLCARMIAALQEQEGEAVIRAREVRLDLERVSVIPNRLFGPMCLRERDRHVLQNLRVVRTVAKRELVRSQGRVEISLSLQRHGLAQIIKALRLRAAIRL